MFNFVFIIKISVDFVQNFLDVRIVFYFLITVT